MSNNLYPRARILVVEAIIGYKEEDKPGALASVIGEMALEALDLGLGAHDLAEELRALAARIDSADPDPAQVIVGDGTHMEAVRSDSPRTLSFKGCA